MARGDAPTRCGFVALLGAPNAGKSTLLNTLIGAKVSIVTHKVQTTRTRITGVCVVGRSQLIFTDTPGIFEPRRRLDRAMVAAAWSGAADADLQAVLIDAKKGAGADCWRIVEGLKDRKNKAVLILNKIDLVKRENLLMLADKLNDSGVFTDIFMISALKGDGVDDLRDFFAAHVPNGPWHYPPDQLTDITERLLAAEITREKLYLRLHQELPYLSTVETESWEGRKDGSVRIGQVIYVERAGQRGIVLGKQGQTIKQIGADARAEMEQLFGRKVHLFLFVKVRERWADDPERYREMGLGFIE
ncbi:MAG: GTPase Era [Sphingomonadales bacterium]